MVVKKSCVAAYPVGWPDGRGISGRMRVEWVAGSTWNRWSDAHGMGGQMTVESAAAEGLLLQPLVNIGVPIANGSLLGIAQLDELRAFALTPPDFEGVGLDLEPLGGFVIGAQVRVERGNCG